MAASSNQPSRQPLCLVSPGDVVNWPEATELWTTPNFSSLNTQIRLTIRSSCYAALPVEPCESKAREKERDCNACSLSARIKDTRFNFQLKSSFVVHVLCAEDRKLLASTLKKSSYKDNQIQKVNNFKNSHTGIGHFGHVGFKEKDNRAESRVRPD